MDVQITRKGLTMPAQRSDALVTPDGRYVVVRGRLWRRSDPALSEQQRQHLVEQLMDARRAKGAAMRAGNAAAREAAREAVDVAKHALGERGPVWWDDGAPDYTRHLAVNTPYADWYADAAVDDGRSGNPPERG